MSTWFFHPGAVITNLMFWPIAPREIAGLDQVPSDGAYLVVANHCSNLDPLVLGWTVGHRTGRVVHFLAKAELRRWPVIGWLASHAGVVFVRRGEGDRAAQRSAVSHLAAGRPVALFPEGHRSRDGQLKEGKSGAAMLAIRAGVPILPVGIAGTQRVFGGAGPLPRRSRVMVRIGHPFEVVHQPAGRIARASLIEATDQIMRRIAELLPPEQQGGWRAAEEAPEASAPDR